MSRGTLVRRSVCSWEMPRWLLWSLWRNYRIPVGRGDLKSFVAIFSGGAPLIDVEILEILWKRQQLYYGFGWRYYTWFASELSVKMGQGIVSQPSTNLVNGYCETEEDNPATVSTTTYSTSSSLSSQAAALCLSMPSNRCLLEHVYGNSRAAIV